MSFLRKQESKIKSIELISTHKALEIILNHTQNYGVEKVDFMQSLGRILKEDILADRDFPPFNRVSMDGTAIMYQSFVNGQKSFKIEGVQAAGSPQKTLQNPENCLEVMTGAMLPINCDVVIPYEQVLIENGVATIQIAEIDYFKNIHKKGLDRKKNEVIIHKNTRISPSEIGVLATVGKSEVLVARNPKVMIVSTGDELVDVSQSPKDYQIRRSNVFTLVALLKELKIDAQMDHITDDKSVLKDKISQYLIEYDVLLFSGAVSKGKFDFIPDVLNELGVEKCFHKVAQRPGKPFWFGYKDKEEDIERGSLSGVEMSRNDKSKETVVFAFPGNPVSTFVSCIKYFIPWFEKSMLEKNSEQARAILAEDVTFKPSLTYYLQVKLEQKEGKLMAYPNKGKGSGDLANLVNSDAFLELPADENEFKKGVVFPVYRYKKS